MDLLFLNACEEEILQVIVSWRGTVSAEGGKVLITEKSSGCDQRRANLDLLPCLEKKIWTRKNRSIKKNLKKVQ